MRTNFSKRIEDFSTLADWADIEYQDNDGFLERLVGGHDPLNDYHRVLVKTINSKHTSEQDRQMLLRLANDINKLREDFIFNIENPGRRPTMNEEQLFDSISEPFLKALDKTKREFGELGDDYIDTLIIVLSSLTYSATKKFCCGQYGMQRMLVMEMLDSIHETDTR